MENTGQENLLINLDKKKIMEPARLTFTGRSEVTDISWVHPQWGNPFQYEFFHLLKKEWKGDKIALVHDSPEMRDYLTEQNEYMYFRRNKQKVQKELRTENGIEIISLEQVEVNRIKKNWNRFINQYVLINYDSHLFMTIDRRLFKRTSHYMPYFVLAQAEDKSDTGGSWAGDRIGIEPIDTPTFDSNDYFEMFRMIGDKSACQLGVEEYERRYGIRDED